MSEIDPNKFNKLKDETEAKYKMLGEVYCPYFKEKISFNSYGLEHLKFKRHGYARNQQDQYMRFKIFNLAYEILSTTKTVQGIFHTQQFEKIKVNSRVDSILTPVSFYEFLAVIDNRRAKAIVKRVNNGQLFFWSIIPFWGINSLTKERRLYTGNPETD